MSEDRFPFFDGLCRILHEANRAICVALGDNSQPAYDDAPDWQKESMRSGVNFIWDMIEAGGVYTEDHAEVSHRQWMDEKLAAGWVYGDVKNVEKKEHPCLRPFKELTQWLRLKDHVCVAIVTGFHECARVQAIMDAE